MANYLERVAYSAGRRAAVAKPPSSAPPLLPVKDSSLPAEGSLSGSDDPSFDLRNQGGVEKRESSQGEKLSDATPTLNERPGTDPETTKLRGGIISRVEPVKSTQGPLSSDTPFTLHLPKTLRPGEQPLAALHLPAGSGSTEFTVDKEPIPVVQSSSDSEIEESATFASGGSRVLGANGIEVRSTSHSAYPSPPPALRVPVPPVVVGSPVKEEQSRISIGSLEVMVNNHPSVAPARPPASTSVLNERASLERRYLDRFWLRR